METHTQSKLVIKGRVQGVFYRAETKRAADRLGVKGYVKNLENGCVEAVFAGEPERVDQMIAWCRKGPALANVEQVLVETISSAPGFDSFKISD